MTATSATAAILTDPAAASGPSATVPHPRRPDLVTPHDDNGASRLGCRSQHGGIELV